jgi:hypothetical protein
MAVIPLTTTDDTFWGPMLKVGDQSFLVQVDTGSATTAIAGSSCSSCDVSPLYTPSSSAKDDKLTAMAVYGDMSGWEGEIYTDKVNLGGGTPDVSFAIGDITDNEMMFFYESNGYQGILGFGPKEAALDNTGAYVDVATKDGASGVMAFELCADDGTMWFGGFDQTKASAPPVYTPLLAPTTDAPFYQININSLELGTAHIGHAADFEVTGISPIVDTGTTLFSLPSSIVDNMLTTINASAGFKALFGDTAKLGTLDDLDNHGCVTPTSGTVTPAMIDAMLPSLTFDFPAVKASDPDVTVAVTPTESYMLDGGDGSWCFGIDDSPDDLTILGDTILAAFVTIIDIDNQQVGWAPDQGCAMESQHRAIDRSTFRPHRPRRGHPLQH